MDDGEKKKKKAEINNSRIYIHYTIIHVYNRIECMCFFSYRVTNFLEPKQQTAG